jgi:hypothetical protein
MTNSYPWTGKPRRLLRRLGREEFANRARHALNNYYSQISAFLDAFLGWDELEVWFDEIERRIALHAETPPESHAPKPKRHRHLHLHRHRKGKG